jgi:hypothetical protein
MRRIMTLRIRRLVPGVMLASLLLLGGSARANETSGPAGQATTMAIDIAIEPDATLREHATAANARLLKVYPKAFALDAKHPPHITLLQRYVRTAELGKLYAAVGKLLANQKLADWKLKALEYSYIPSGELGLAGIVVAPTDELLALQRKLIDAVAPFTLKTGTAAAYVTTLEAPEIDQPTLDSVASFVPKQTGKAYDPQVSIGLAPKATLEAMLAEPFAAFTFSPSGVSIYQLGNFGTAQKKLERWKLKP